MLFVLAINNYCAFEFEKFPYKTFIIVVDGFKGKL